MAGAEGPRPRLNLRFSPAMPTTIRSYQELLGHMREALRRQHPEWEPALSESYEARLTCLLSLFATRTTNS